MHTLLFDVDDTLLDFKLAEKKALAAVMAAENIPFTKDIEMAYKIINQGLWRSFEEGKISKETISESRFGLLFDLFNKEVDSKKLGEAYRHYLSQGHDLLGNSREILERLAPKYNLYVVTNGVAQTQYQRLKDSNLMSYFKDIFVSEEVGYQKPMKEYFDHVFQRIPNFDREKTMIIGDSLHSDIKGGQMAQIQTVWLNPNEETAEATIQPDYTIRQLDEIFTILEG
jgi:2-haloacid dehalogenase